MKRREDRPNILVIMTDSQGFNILGDVGDGFVHTPNIDKLAADGMTFMRAYNVCPLCAPARAGLFTGQYPYSTGAWANDIPIYDNVKTMGQYFQEAGYRTGYIGKWHLDGFDYFGTGKVAEGYEEDYWFDGRNYLDNLSDEERMLWRQGLSTSEEIRANGIDREFTWASGITTRAIDFLETKDERPYLLVVSYDEPHGPSTCPEPFASMYERKAMPLPENFYDDLDKKPSHQKVWANHKFSHVSQWEEIYQPLYFGCSSFVDDEIGKVLEYVEDEVVTVFTTDHGHYLGAHKLDEKGPAIYEEVVNVPLIIRNGTHNRGVKSNAIISHIDIMPTLMEMAGIERLPNLNGSSMLQLLNQTEMKIRDYAMITFNRFGVSHDSWFGFIPIRAIVDERYKLIINLDYEDELYDLFEDPFECSNCILEPEYSEIRDELFLKLIEHMNETRDPFRGVKWLNRQWSPLKVDYEKGERRLKPYDGNGVHALNYNTGLTT